MFCQNAHDTYLVMIRDGQSGLECELKQQMCNTDKTLGQEEKTRQSGRKNPDRNLVSWCELKRSETLVLTCHTLRCLYHSVHLCASASPSHACRW